MALTIGTRLDAFEIIGPLGAGGMGEVYRATDTKLGREVAIKTLPAALASDKDRLARFEREAKLLATVNHAHIASVYSLDEHEGTLYIAMELVEGETLDEKLESGALPIEDSLRIALQIAEALEAAHEKGVVHRDLKPANIMLTANGEVKVLDFGLAKAFSGDPDQATLAHSPALSAAMTQQGLIIGTAGYMSPEQASGQATDQRADIWAFGVVLYEMLTGLPLFSGESVPHVLAAVLQTEPDWRRLPKNLHPRLKALLERCLRKNVRDRYHAIADVRVDIEEVLQDPEDATPAPPTTRPYWRRTVPISAITLLLGALLASIYFIAVRQPAARPEPLAALPVSRLLVTPPETAPLADTGGYDVAISPDGSRLAYFGQDPENGEVALFVREMDELEPRLVAGPEYFSSGGNFNPFFSPDGNSVGFRSSQGLMRVAVDGGPPLKIMDDPGTFLGAAWGSDDTLVYSNGDGIYRVSAGGGGTPERLTPDPAENSGLYIAPSFVPGERAVLMSSADGNDERIATLDLSTGEIKTLVEGGVQNPRYAASGHIVYARGTTLMAVPFDPGELAVNGRPVAIQQDIRQPGPGTAADFTLSASGTLAYVPNVTGEGSTSEVVWVDRGGRVLGSALSEPIESPRDPRLSPTGDRLVLRSGQGLSGTLWVYDLSGRPPIPLANVAANFFPAWSPDGTEIAFTSNRGGAFLIYTTPADGSQRVLEPLRPALRLMLPAAWSTADELILVRLGTGPTGDDILIKDLEPDAELRDLVVTEDNEFDAALSPSGRWLAYVSDRSGRPEIWAKAYPDGVSVRISSGGGTEPRWSVDESELFYLEGNNMMAVAVKTDDGLEFDAAEQLFSGGLFFNASGTGANSYDVAADGRFLMIRAPSSSAGSGATSIVVVQNWVSELDRLAPAAE